MPAAKNVNINIEGNVSDGNIIVGDNNLVIGDVNGGVVNIIQPASKATFDPRTRPINLRPRAFPNLLNRTTEIENIKNAITNSMPVTLFGESGIGKTSLLRQVAHLKEIKNFSDGIIYLIANGEERDDLLQLIFDSFYVSSQNQKPTEGQLRDDLNEIRALIILDDLTLSREDAAFLLNAVPNSTFIFASIERSLWGEGEAIGLDGLPEKEALELFERELDRKLNVDEKEPATQICKILLFHPLRILQTASLIREDGLSVSETFTKLTATRTQSPVLEVTLSKTNETQKKILSLLAVAGGFALTREHLSALAGSANFDSEMKSLLGRGFIEAQGASFSLNNEAVSSLSQMWDLSGWEDALLNHFSSWLQTSPKDMLVEQVASTMFHLIQRAGEKKQWKHVVTLGRRLEQIYALKKKWDGWLKILKLLQMAARALLDKKLEGWALHQLGSRAMCIGSKAQAQEFLKQALNIRNAIGDKAGVAVTQHNMNLLMNVPTPKKITKQKAKSKISNFQKILIVGGAGGAVAIVLLLLAVGAYIFTLPTPTALPTPTNTLPPTDVPTLTSLPPTRVPTVTRVTPTRVPTYTPTPKPIVLYDFILQADQADWSVEIAEKEIKPIPFYEEETEEVTPDDVMRYSLDFGQPYVGWDSDNNPPLEDGSREDLVLLSFTDPIHGPSNAVFGSYDLIKTILQSGDHFKVRVGHVTLPEGFFEPIGDVGFQIFFSEFPIGSDLDISIVSGDKTENIYVIGGQPTMIDSLDGIIREYDFAIPRTLYGKSGYFILKVVSGGLGGNDWAVWVEAKLIGLPR